MTEVKIEPTPHGNGESYNIEAPYLEDSELRVFRPRDGGSPTVDLVLGHEGYTGHDEAYLEMTPDEARTLAKTLVDLADKAAQSQKG